MKADLWSGVVEPSMSFKAVFSNYISGTLGSSVASLLELVVALWELADKLL